MDEVDQAAKIISEHVDADANIIFGATIDEKLVDQIRIIVIATGFDDTKQRLIQMTRPAASAPRPTPLSQQPIQQPPLAPHQQFQPRTQPVAQDPTPTSEDDPWDVPAFLRQKS